MDEILLYKKLIDSDTTDGIENLNPCIMEYTAQYITEKLSKSDWKKKLHYLELLKKLIDMYPTYIVRCLPELTIKLRECMQDLKPIVKEQSLVVLKQICYAIQNPDIQKSMDAILDAYINPIKNTTNAIDKLYATTFVNEVDTATLSLIIPILIRSNSEKNTVYKRRSTVIMDNLCKLVTDPKDALLFYNTITKFLNKVIDEVQFEEIRKVAENALKNITRLYNNCDKTSKTFNCVYEFLSKQTLDANIAEYTSHLIYFLVKNRITCLKEWENCIDPYYHDNSFFGTLYDEFCENITEEIDVGEEDLCNVEFSLAYGSIVLLHKAKLHLILGRKYGLVGPNGAGKSTLMKSIANGTLSGFPEDIKTCYVAHEIQGDYDDVLCVDYIINECNVSKEEAETELINFKFDLSKKIGELSGGWKMKLALLKAIISKANLLLLDEPTNHLDYVNVEWLTNYIKNLKNVSCLIVSHEPSFINAVCTDIVHYESNKKLKRYKGNLDEFIRVHPEARMYYEMKDPEKKFIFPDPGPLEGVKSLTKAVLKMSDVTFQYPNTLKPQLVDVAAQCSLASRVAIVGMNGAGKSTLIKVLLGELVPETGDIYKHPNLRVAYISQHAFKNIEEHLDKTPVQYIQWRYSSGVDKETMSRDALKISPEEEKARQDKLKERKLEKITEIVNRKHGKRDFEYEVKWENMALDNSFLTRKELEELGYSKLVMEFDEKLASERQMSGKKLTTGEIQKHLEGFGIPIEIGTHNYISALSGGQKIKIAFGAAMWGNPHILIADEPSNFLDRESLASLVTAIKEFKGGVVIISHNREFTQEICPETWFVENGSVRVEGADYNKKMEQNRIKMEKEQAKKLPVQQNVKLDSFGNVVKEQVVKQELDRKQRKILEKKRKEMIKNSQDTYDIDVQLGLL